MNQSKVVVNTCSWFEARENAWEEFAICFGFTQLIGRKNGSRFFKPIVQRWNAQLLFYTHRKTVLENSIETYLESWIDTTYDILA